MDRAMTDDSNAAPDTPRAATQPHGTTEDQIREMESEGPGTSNNPAVDNSEQARRERSATGGTSALVKPRDNGPMANTIKPSTTDNAEGTRHEGKGEAKKQIAQVIGDADEEAEGDAEKPDSAFTRS
jgi:uncharacterized protein YjbJ (UPF0337 family)